MSIGKAWPDHARTEVHGSAGADLRSSEAVTLPPGGRAAVPTGIAIEIPPDHVGLVWPRSGLAVRAVVVAARLAVVAV